MFTTRLEEAACLEALHLICILSKMNVFSVTEPRAELLQLSSGDNEQYHTSLSGFSQFMNLVTRVPRASIHYRLSHQRTRSFKSPYPEVVESKKM